MTRKRPSTGPQVPRKRRRVPFEHTPLEDPKNQIRLLELQPGCGVDDIRCKVLVRDRAALPEYEAISYTWGSPELVRTIYIDGKPLRVGHNCFYALWQVRLATDFRTIWQDAICINQSDTFEKGHQVQGMAGVFKNAKTVLVSLAHQIDDAVYLSRVFEKFDEICKLALTASLEQLPTEMVFMVEQQLKKESELAQGDHEDSNFFQWLFYIMLRLQEISSNDLGRFLRAFTPFGIGPYWTRLWVHPELALARDAVFFYGSHHCRMETMMKLSLVPDEIEFNAMLYPATFGWDICFLKSMAKPMWRMLHQAKLSLTSNDSLFGGCQWMELSKLQCSDPRDRIHALIPLINWERLGIQPITVDYARTRIDLAFECLRFCVDLDRVKDLVISLGLGGEESHVEVETFLKSRKLRAPTRMRASPQKGLCDCDRSGPGGEGVRFTTEPYCYLDKDRLGGLAIPGPWQTGETWTKSIGTAVADTLVSDLSKAYQVVRRLSTSDQPDDIVGVIPKSAQAGDIVFDLAMYPRGPMWMALVLRASYEGTYKILGMALLVDDDQISPFPQNGGIELRLDRADAMAIALCTSRLPQDYPNTMWTEKDFARCFHDVLDTSVTSTRFSSYAVDNSPEQKRIGDICRECGRFLTEEGVFAMRQANDL